MALISQTLAFQFFGTILALAVAVYLYLKLFAYKYWSSRGVFHTEPVAPLGHIWPQFFGKVSLGEFFRDIYLQHKKEPIMGLYIIHKPNLVINDPELIRYVLTKEFSHFHDRGAYCNEQQEPLSGHLFLLSGLKWRNLRTKLSPTFTSGKIKQMFAVVKNCGLTLSNYVVDHAKRGDVIEVKDIMARFSTDVIASIAFGLECNSLENPDTEFRKYGRLVVQSGRIRNMLFLLCPEMLVRLNVRVTEPAVAKFFTKTLIEAIEYRMANHIVRNDFLNLIIQLIQKGHVRDDDDDDKQESVHHISDAADGKITLLEGIAQAFVFWVAGFETSSSTVSHCLFELAQNQEVQDKLAEEINGVLNSFEDMTYDSINEMPYLHKVVSETLRKYPSVPILNRVCTKDIDLPNMSLHVEKGTNVTIPIFGIHMDPDIWPKPDVFDPERFTKENIASRHSYSYLPFGEGPRICIGMRFGLLQTKVAIISMLSKYRFTPGSDRKALQWDVSQTLLSSKHNMMLKITER